MDGGMRPNPGRDTTDEARAELESLSAALADRTSVSVLAWGIVLAFVAAIATGVTVKLLIDSAGIGPAHALLAAADVALAAAALVRILRARRLLRGEAANFERLRRARRLLGIDA